MKDPRVTPASSLEALAIAALRRYGYERRRKKDAEPFRYHQAPGRPTEGSKSSLHDALIVRCIDMQRVLDRLATEEATALQLHYVDGWSLATVGTAIGRCTRTAFTVLESGRRNLTRALEEADLL